MNMIFDDGRKLTNISIHNIMNINEITTVCNADDVTCDIVVFITFVNCEIVLSHVVSEHNKATVGKRIICKRTS